MRTVTFSASAELLFLESQRAPEGAPEKRVVVALPTRSRSSRAGEPGGADGAGGAEGAGAARPAECGRLERSEPEDIVLNCLSGFLASLPSGCESARVPVRCVLAMVLLMRRRRALWRSWVEHVFPSGAMERHDATKVPGMRRLVSRASRALANEHTSAACELLRLCGKQETGEWADERGAGEFGPVPVRDLRALEASLRRRLQRAQIELARAVEEALRIELPCFASASSLAWHSTDPAAEARKLLDRTNAAVRIHAASELRANEFVVVGFLGPRPTAGAE